MTLDAPRFEGGPHHCPVANLGFFPTLKAMREFQESLCMSAASEWRCSACDGWHFWPRFKSPSGDSSGTSRRQHIPQSIKILIAQTAVP